MVLPTDFAVSFYSRLGLLCRGTREPRELVVPEEGGLSAEIRFSFGGLLVDVGFLRGHP